MMDPLVVVQGTGKSVPLGAFIYANMTGVFNVSYNIHYV